jgi:transcription elongation GreA/GreB family factor
MSHLREAVIRRALDYYQRREKALENKQQEQLDALDLEGEPTDLDEHSFIDQMVGEQVERESEQLDRVQNLIANLKRMQADTTDHTEVKFGTVIETDQINFLVGAPMRRFTVEDKTFVGLSPEAPLGREMEGRKQGETVSYQGNKFVIEAIH